MRHIFNRAHHRKISLTMTNHHTITLYPTLVKRLKVRGWSFSGINYPNKCAYTKQCGAIVYLVIIDRDLNRATFTRYERLSG